MAYNPNPFTERQERFLKALRDKMVEIRDPNSAVLDNRWFEFFIQHTKKFGDIPKIRFRPNSAAIKEEIMLASGYKTVAGQKSWREKKFAAASAFDKNWDCLVFRLVKAGRMLAAFNQRFAEKGANLSRLISLVQECVAPEHLDGDIFDAKAQETSKGTSYLDELAQVK